MPQPLSSVNPKAGLFIGGNADSPSVHRPELALLAMRVISEWALLESFLSAMFIQMLGANPGPAAAMYAALSGAASQKAAFRALARISLVTEDERDVFEAIMSLFNTAGKDRGKIAHWVWGHSAAIPDGVLLGDPQHLTDYRVAVEEYIAELSKMAFPGPRPDLPEPPRDHIFVYYASDFTKMSERLQRLISFVNSFTFVLIRRHPVNAGGQGLQKLLLAPEIQTIVDRLRQNRKTAQEARRQ